MPEEERGRAGSVKPGIWGQSVGMWPHDEHQYFSPDAYLLLLLHDLISYADLVL